MRRGVALAGLTLLAVAAAAFFWWRAQAPTEVTLMHPPLDGAQWTAYVARVDARPVPPAERVEPLLRAFSAANRAEARAADPSTDADYLRASAALRDAAWDFVEGRTADAYLDVGRRLGFRLLDLTAALLEACADRPLDACLAAGGPAVDAYTEVGGRFVQHAAAAGLVERGRLVDGRLPLSQGLFLRHWMAWVAHRTDISGFAWPEERTWWLRWKLEFQADGRLDGRLAAADELGADATYPADLNAGVLLYQAGRFDEAAARFARSSLPQATAYRRMAERGGR